MSKQSQGVSLPADREFEKEFGAATPVKQRSFNPALASCSGRMGGQAKPGQWAKVKFAALRTGIGKFNSNYATVTFLKGTLHRGGTKNEPNVQGQKIKPGTVCDMYAPGQLGKYFAEKKPGAVCLIRYTGMTKLPKGHKQAGKDSHGWQLADAKN